MSFTKAKPNLNQCEVILVGCGCPLRGMGWYHAVQLLENRCPSAKLCHIVEPWFMGAGENGPGGAEFLEFRKETELKHGVQFHRSMREVPDASDGIKRMALISGRTADNPRLLSEAITSGCMTVYLEKPGAPTLEELEDMKKRADYHGVTVLMGYNKNVSKYVKNTRDFANSVTGGHVTFVSNNTYDRTDESLGECFERNKEGMLKNMVIHELALLVSFFGVTVQNLCRVEADVTFSSMQTLVGPSGKEYTDFDKIKFTITTNGGQTVSVQADRCGGDNSYATVRNVNGDTLFRHSMPDEEDAVNVALLEKKYPGAMPYFFVQDKDYVSIKERVADFCANGRNPKGVATIETACETLRLAEYLISDLQKQLR